MSENLAAEFERKSGSIFSIGVAHCNVGGDPNHDNYAPCTKENLVDVGMDYWALGHIHERKVLSGSEPTIVFPGNTQGRSIRELGPRGCYLVKVDTAGNVGHEFVSTDAVRWFMENIDIVDLRTMDDLLEKLERTREEVRSRAQGRPSVLRMRISGRGDLHPELARVDPDQDIAARLREDEVERDDFVWVESVHLVTRPTIDIDQRRKTEDFVGDFLCAADKIRADKDSTSALRDILASRSESRVITKLLDELSDPELLDILSGAEAYGLDQLLPPED